MTKTLPNFLIIGAMKCGTSTLHTQLALQPNVYMSALKEPNFFSDDPVWAQGLDWYKNNFAASGDAQFVGESSTHYTKLPTYPHTIQRLQSTLSSDTKFIYVLRDPIERLISQYIHEWTMGHISVPLDRAIEMHPELVEYSCYAKQIDPFLKAFGVDKVFITSFEYLKHDPQAFLNEIGDFLGTKIPWIWDKTISPQNVSRERMRSTPLLTAVRSSPTLTWLRRTLLSDRVRNRVKKRYQMKERPVLATDQQKALELKFEAKFSQLKRLQFSQYNPRYLNS